MSKISNDKITYLNEARQLIKNKEKIIKKRKLKQAIRRVVFFSIIIISIFIVLLLKLPYFNINKISVIGNNNITTKDIIKLSEIHIGNNIFYINSNKCEKNLLKNPYILNAEIKKKLPNEIIIDVTERKAALYVLNNGDYYIVDENSVVLEKRENINNMQLKRLIGADTKNISIGKVLSFDNKRKVDIVKKLTNIVNSSAMSKNISMIDVSDIYNIKAYMGNLCIKLGNEEKLDEKFNKAFAIINEQNMEGQRGYIDVSYDGNPVFFIKK